MFSGRGAGLAAILAISLLAPWAASPKTLERAAYVKSVESLRVRAARVRAGLELASIEGRLRSLVGKVAPSASRDDSLTDAVAGAIATLRGAGFALGRPGIPTRRASTKAIFARGAPHAPHYETVFARKPARSTVQMIASAAALRVARALDASLPGMRRAKATGVSVAGCDVVDELPLLCVGSGANNVYTAPAALTIDGGGDDVYENGTGAAFGGDEPVAVVVDLAGNDRYVARRGPVDGVVAGSGGAVGPAVAIVVDLAGNDTHIAYAPRDATYLVAQGAGMEGGIGVLFDAGGDDRYIARVANGTNSGVIALAQGAGLGLECGGCEAIDNMDTPGAVGALIDVGGGRDAYILDGGSARQATIKKALVRLAYGQGAASYGAAGALVDDGGEDSFNATMNLKAAPANVYPLRRGDVLWDPTPFGLLVTQGSSDVASTGVLLEGRGRTKYFARITGSGFLQQILVAHGSAFHEGSLAILDDLSGDDRYHAAVSMATTRRVTVDARCRCDRARLIVHGSNNPDGSSSDSAMPNQLYAQGGGFYEAAGLLSDHAGDDVYESTMLERLRVALRDRIRKPRQPAKLHVVGYDPPLMMAQGTAISGATGVLVDDEGSDSYTTRAFNDVSAAARSAHTRVVPEVVAIAPQTYFQSAQGTGDLGFPLLGALIDSGGRDDRFYASSDKRAVTAPDPRGAFEVGSEWPPAQGGGVAGAFVALGQDPVVVARPSRPLGCAAMTTHHGYGVWTECRSSGSTPSQQPPDSGGAIGAFGAAPFAVGAAPALELIAPTPASATESQRRIALAARLLDPANRPMAGVPVRFTLQVNAAVGSDPLWLNLFQANAITDGRGIARARVPVFVSGLSLSGLAFRTAATFDGARHIYPMHVAEPLKLSLGDIPSAPLPAVAPLTARRSYPTALSDPLFRSQWGPARIHAPEAWRETGATGFGIRVAVIDSGIDPTHADLRCAGKVLEARGSDMIGDGTGPRDANGHGTHVAGIIGACANNGAGTVGVAPDATLVPFRVLDASNQGWPNAVALAINRATDAGAHVINLSITTSDLFDAIPGDVKVMDDAIAYATARGVVIVAAAGNDALPICEYPAAAEGVVCVGATDRRDRLTAYSNFPAKLEPDRSNSLVAPGGAGTGSCDAVATEILSLWPMALDECGRAGYEAIAGTSMATPHVSGVAALVYDRLGGVRDRANARRVIDALTSSARDLGTPGYDPLYGSGMIDAVAACEAVDT